MHVVTVPSYLDDRGLDTLAQGIAAWPPPGRLLVDARACKWSSPYGFCALLTLGQAMAEARLERPHFAVPDAEPVRTYWAKAGFLKYAAEYFDLHGKVPRKAPDEQSDVLLPVMPVRGTDDVHTVVDLVSQGASRILTTELGLEAKATGRFTMTFSEAVQNITEHAGTGGWVAIHAYNWRRRLGRRVVVMAVSDAGIGFRRSLEATESRKFGNRWSDGTALETALIQEISRFRDPGRGQGLAMIKRTLREWQGKISIRSGTARLAIVPAWDDDQPLAEHLPYFPGSQVQIVVPAREEPAK
jgi:anti-sigma regulatory factor (Ser/Thr protein kinase)